MADIIGKNYSTVLDSAFEDGFWTTHCTITETFYHKNGRVDRESVSGKGIDREGDSANRTALSAALQQYRAEVLDRGFSNLIQARREDEDDSPEINPDTTP